MGWLHQEETTAWQKTKALVAPVAGGFLQLSSMPSSHFMVVNFSLSKLNYIWAGEWSSICRVLASHVGSPEFDAPASYKP